MLRRVCGGAARRDATGAVPQRRRREGSAGALFRRFPGPPPARCSCGPASDHQPAEAAAWPQIKLGAAAAAHLHFCVAAVPGGFTLEAELEQLLYQTAVLIGATRRVSKL